MRRAPLIAVIAALAVGPAAVARDSSRDREERALARLLTGRVAGPAERCISEFRTENAAIYGDALVWQTGRTTWVSRVANCPALRRDPLLVFEVWGGQYCHRDVFRTVDRGSTIPGPFCQLGEFVPWRKPK